MLLNRARTPHKPLGRVHSPNPRLTRSLLCVLLSKAFLTAVLQDYGRSQGLSVDVLTFTHHVLSDTADTKEKEFSLIIQKKLNIVRRAFKVLAC